MVWLMIVLFFTLIFIGVPIVFSMVIATLFGMLVFDVPLMMIIQKMHSGIDAFPYLAIPFFVLAGALMETGGISLRLVNLAKAMVGHIRGGLGMVVVVSEMLFSGISGSSVADASALGSVMIPAMKRSGYSNEHSVSIITAASGAGMLIPPCLVMIVMASISDQSVAALFFGGFLPGAFMCFCLMGLIYWQARRGLLPGGETDFHFNNVIKTFWFSIIPLIMPVIIFGGILGGVATATEVAVLGVLYAIIVSLFVYKEIKVIDLPKIFLETVLVTGSVMVLLGASAGFTYILATQQIPQMIKSLLLSITTNPYVFLVIANFIFIVATALLDGLPALLILFPILFPISNQFGIHPLQFTLLAVAANGIGLIMPPIGLLLIVVCGIARTSLSSVFRTMLPYVAILIASLLVIMFIPWIILVVPRMIWPNI
jgi:tripartite ATP-independent transporter DctM subunit